MPDETRLKVGRNFRPLIVHGHVQDSHARGRPIRLKQSYGLCLLESGSVEVESAESAAGRTRRTSPDLFCSQPGVVLHPGSGVRLRYIAFIDDVGHAIWDLPVQIPEAFYDRVRRLLFVWTDSWWRSDQDLWRCNAQLALLLLDLLPIACQDDQGESAQTDWLHEFKTIVIRDLPHGPTAATMATAMGISRSQLYRRLSQYTDQTVKGFIQDIRLQEATRLLLQPQYRVASVGRMVGLARSTVFTRWFRKQTGLSPTEWRREMIPGFTVGQVNGQKRRDMANWSANRRYP